MESLVSLGSIRVETTSHRGFTPEELADHALGKIVSIAESANPMIQAQAHAFQDRLRFILVTCMYQAIESYKTTQFAHLNLQGHSDMASIVHKI